MKKYRFAITLLVAGLLSLSSAHAAEVEVGADIASAYVFRGATLSDGFVLQPYLNISGLPVQIGLWGNYNTKDYKGVDMGETYSEIDMDISYPLPIEGVDISVGYLKYFYPGIGMEEDAEVYASAAIEGLLVKPALSVFYGIEGGVEDDLYIEGRVSTDVDIIDNLVVTASTSLGYKSMKEAAADGSDVNGMSHFTIDCSAEYVLSQQTKANGTISYISQLDDEVLPDAAFDVEILISVGISYIF